MFTPAEFVKEVIQAYSNNLGIFSHKVNAEDLLPKGLTGKEKALYLFYVIQLDYALKSQLLYAGAKALWQANCEFFTPEYLLSIKEAELREVITKFLRPRYINEILKRYSHNSQVLVEKYSSDPRRIFSGSKSSNEVLTRLKEFRGFGPKIGNFFVRTMLNTFNYTYPDISDMLPPVDVHDVNIAYLLGFVDSRDMTTKNITRVKVLWHKACIDAKESWLIFDKALWLLGSEGKPKSRGELVRLMADFPSE